LQVAGILLVDDNIDFVTSLSLLLGRLGHEVRTAHDARQALEIAREFEPEVAFLDLGLPRVSGYALACKLHELPQTADTVLIALSGWGQQHHLERSAEAGFALHLVKPVELDKIRSALSSLVEAS
jgi:CheY-like chemotaxis protein